MNHALWNKSTQALQKSVITEPISQSYVKTIYGVDFLSGHLLIEGIDIDLCVKKYVEIATDDADNVSRPSTSVLLIVLFMPKKSSPWPFCEIFAPL